jgi:hypothetical protein
VLLNALPDAIAMAEPMTDAGEATAEEMLYPIDNFISQSRTRALQQGLFRSRLVGGVVSDNFVSEPERNGGRRKPANICTG